jgi:hypothetical protein
VVKIQLFFYEMLFVEKRFPILAFSPKIDYVKWVNNQRAVIPDPYFLSRIFFLAPLGHISFLGTGGFDS